MASPISEPVELNRSTSVLLTPLEYFTDSMNAINGKSDLTLLVGNEKFYCHRLLLSLISPVFTRMFDGEFREHSAREIKLEGKKSETILELLKYIYPQFDGGVNHENVEDFILLADEYMIDNLKKPCKTILLQQLELYKYVLLPTQHKLQQSSMKSKHFHASDSALDASQRHELESPVNHSAAVRFRVHLPEMRLRHNPNKPMSAHLKAGDKNGSSSKGNPRYVLFLDQNQMPIFHDKCNHPITFGSSEVELWIRRLRILYQIDRGRNYGEVIEKIIAILQFIPASLLIGLVKVTMETLSIDETLLNDIARARMYMLEAWSTDGDSSRLVELSPSYGSMSPLALASAADQHSENAKTEENSVFQAIPPNDARIRVTAAQFDSDTDDSS